MPFITLGSIEKKLYLIVLISIEILINKVALLDGREYYYGNLNNLEEELGYIIIGIIAHLKFKPKNEIITEKRKSWKNMMILIVLKLIKISYVCLYFEFIKEEKYYYDGILNTVNGAEIILISFITFILLKYKYYAHHIIFMIIFCASGISNDIILDNYSKLNYDYLFIYIIYIIIDITLYCYLKYMMDVLYYSYIELMILNGIIGLVIKLSLYIVIIIYEHINDIEIFVPNLVSYLNETNIFIIIFFQFFYFILANGIHFLLTLLILYYLKPNHMIIADEIDVYSFLIFYEERSNKYYTLISFTLQVISLLFYFEIFELNIFGLNKNTIKNIQIREKEELERKKSFLSGIELGDYKIRYNENTLFDDEEEKDN